MAKKLLKLLRRRDRHWQRGPFATEHRPSEDRPDIGVVVGRNVSRGRRVLSSPTDSPRSSRSPSPSGPISGPAPPGIVTYPPLIDELLSMKVCEELETVSLRAEVYRPFSVEPDWQLPLPSDVMLDIISIIFEDDTSSLSNLSRGCNSLHKLCRPVIFRRFYIIAEGADIQKTATFLSENPAIVDLIQDLRIIADRSLGDGYRRLPSHIIGCFIFLLSRPFKNLRRIETTLLDEFGRLVQVKRAFNAILSCPTLREIMLEGSIDDDLLRHLPQVSYLELRDVEWDQAPLYTELESSYCEPLHLRIQNRMDSTPHLPVHRNFGLRLCKLQKLDVYVPEQIMPTLFRNVFYQCSSTLTSLEVYVYPGSRHVLFLDSTSTRLTTLNLSALRTLQFLTITTDISLEQSAGLQFQSLVSSLATLPSPHNLEKLTVLLRALKYQELSIPQWETFDALFWPHPKDKWPYLGSVVIRVMNEMSLFGLQSKIGSRLPTLAGSRLVDFGVLF